MKMYLCLFFAHRMDVAGLLDRSYFTDLGEHSIYFPPPFINSPNVFSPPPAGDALFDISLLKGARENVNYDC